MDEYEAEEDRKRIRRAREDIERASREEAMHSYRQSHPLVKMKEIDYMEAVIKYSEDFFNKKPEAAEFQLTKALLGREWNLSVNPMNRKIAELVDQFEFMIDSKRGYLIIGKSGFFEWLNLKAQIDEEKQAEESMRERYPDLKAELNEAREANKRAKETIDSIQKEIIGINSETKEFEKKKEALQGRIPEFQSKRDQAKKEYDELEAEKKNLEDEQNKISDELKGIVDDERNMFPFGLWIGNWLNATGLSFPELLGIVRIEKEPMKKLYKVYLEQGEKSNHNARNWIISAIIIAAIILIVLAKYFIFK